MRYHDLILILVLEIQVIRRLFAQDRKYSSLLQQIAKYDLDKDELPQQKELLATLGIPRAKLMNLMQGLYEGFQTKLSNANAYAISDTEYWLYAKSRENFWVVGMDKLDVIPRVREEVTIQFLRGESYTGQYFKVDSVHHNIENGKHRIEVYLVDRLEK